MTPTIGRIVHYVDQGVHLPALITKVWGETCVNLTVFANGSDPFTPNPHKNSAMVTSVSLDGMGIEDRSWHWPERE